MKSRVLRAVLTVGVSGAIVVATPVAPARSSGFPAPSAAEDDLLGRLNAERTSRGLAAIARSISLDSAADDWSAHMAGGGCGSRRLCHRTDLLQLANASFPGAWTAIGENVGLVPAGGTLASLHGAFMASPGHAANVLNPKYNALGIGVAIATDGTLFVTYEFMAVRTNSAPPPAQAPPAPPAPAPGPSSSELPAPPAGSSDEDTLLYWINHLRANRGLAPLHRHPVLDREAAVFAGQLADGTACRDGVVLCHRRDLKYVARTAVGKARWWSENVGYRRPGNVADQFLGFVQSKRHLDNMLHSRITFVGIGYRVDPQSGRAFTVLEFVAARDPERVSPAGGSGCGWVPSSLRKGTRHAPYVRTLQCALATAGVYDGPVDGVYDDDVMEAVKRLEVRNGVRRPKGKASLSTRRWLGVV